MANTENQGIVLKNPDHPKKGRNCQAIKISYHLAKLVLIKRGKYTKNMALVIDLQLGQSMEL